MKTFFIYSGDVIEDHVGEEYDDAIEVDFSPTTETVPEWFNRIRGRIRRLWHEGESDDRYIEVYLDAPLPYHAMLLDMQMVLEKEEFIEMELAYLDKIQQIDENLQVL